MVLASLDLLLCVCPLLSIIEFLLSSPSMATNHPSRCRCSPLSLLAFFLISAIPLAAIVALDRRTTASPSTYEYTSLGWFRECAKWDGPNRRFLVSTFLDAGVSEVAVSSGAALQEREVVRDPDVKGNVSLGIAVDGPRRRLMVTYADAFGRRYGAVAAYDLVTWDRIFLTQLAGPGDEEESFANDVAVDTHGNAYITDAKANRIWKIDPTGDIISVIRSPTFRQKPEWYNNLIGLNGIVHHPDGFLLAIHTSSGCLFKIEEEEVTVVRVGGGGGCSLLMGDGLELMSPTELVVAGSMPSARLVESRDGWQTGRVKGRWFGPVHRVATAATVVDGRVYVNHLVGGGFGRRSHVIAEANFFPPLM